MIKHKKNVVKRIIVIATILFQGFSVYAVNNITFSMDSCTSTSATLSFDVYVTNTSLPGDPSPMLLTALSIGVNYSESITNGGLPTVSLVPNSWDQSVPNLGHIYGTSQVYNVNTTAGGAGNDQMQIQIANISVSCTSSGGNAAPVLPLNVPIKVGRFILSNNATPWTINSNPALTFNTSATIPNRNTGANICNAGTAVSANTSTTRFVQPGCTMILNPGPVSVPTVSEWGLLIMSSVMFLVALFFIRKNTR
jgi:hypothetical protein